LTWRWWCEHNTCFIIPHSYCVRPGLWSRVVIGCSRYSQLPSVKKQFFDSRFVESVLLAHQWAFFTWFCGTVKTVYHECEPDRLSPMLPAETSLAPAKEAGIAAPSPPPPPCGKCSRSTWKCYEVCWRCGNVDTNRPKRVWMQRYSGKGESYDFWNVGRNACSRQKMLEWQPDKQFRCMAGPKPFKTGSNWLELERNVPIRTRAGV
jgi:hypothetical protein